MQVIDIVAICIVVLSLAIGILLGFGKTLKMFTGGVVGIIISVVVTYFSIGVVASWGFVQELMGKLVASLLENGSGFCKFLRTIGIEKILLAIILFFVIQVSRLIIVNVIKNIAEADNRVIKGFNRFFGAVFFFAIVLMVILLIFHLVDIIGGSAEESFRKFLHGFFRLDRLFDNNPLKYIIKQVLPA